MTFKILPVLGVLLIASMAQAETIRDRSLHLTPYVVVAAGQAADVTMTMRKINEGCVEGNRGAFGSSQPTTARLIGIKAAAVLPSLIAMAVLQKSGHQKAANTIGGLMGGIGFGAAAYNLSVTCR